MRKIYIVGLLKNLLFIYVEYKETEVVELKVKYNETFEKEVVAFLNTNEGNIYLGIDDNGQIVGIENIDETLKIISNSLTDKISPCPLEYVQTTTYNECGKDIILIQIEKGKSLYYIKKYGRSSIGCFIRVGTTVRGMKEEQIENV